MITKNDLTECDDCGRRIALLPARICFRCQIPRFERMRDIYRQSAAIVREQRKADHKEKLVQQAF